MLSELNKLFHPIAIYVAFFGFACSRSRGEEWWQFRGPNAGHAAGSKLPEKWGGLYDPLWRVAIPGKGWSSPIVVGDRIWITSADEEAIEDKKATDKISQLEFSPLDIVFDASVKLFALELDAETGAILRRIDLFEKKDPPPIHAMNSYASPSPTTDGERIYCHFGALGTACIEIAMGKVLWKRVIAVEEYTGGGVSPVLWNGKLILACDGADQQFIIALDKLTGETVWQTARPPIKVNDDTLRRAFSTPIIVQSNGRTQLISLAAQWLISYNPENGSECWRAKVGTGYSLVPMPVFDRDRVFVCTGFTAPELVAVSTTGMGDVTETAELWRYSRQVPDISTPIIVGDEIYFVSSGGIATCLNIDSGSMHWQHRLGGNFASSPTYSAERIFFTSTAGVTTVIQPGREYVELGTNELFGETFSSLAVYKQSFLLRTHPFLFRIGN